MGWWYYLPNDRGMFGHLHTTIECHLFCVGERGLTHIMKWENFHITVISDESSPNGDWLLLCCFCGWFGFTNTTYWLKLGSMAFCLELAEDIEESFRLATNWMRRLFPSNYALWSPYGSFSHPKTCICLVPLAILTVLSVTTFIGYVLYLPTGDTHTIIC